MDLKTAILANWPFKAAAVTLSLLLWFNVTADRELSGSPIRTRLDLQVSDTAWSILEAPAEVETIFQGRRRDIVPLFDPPVLRKVIDTVTGSVMEIPLEASEVDYDRGLDVRALAVQPSRVTVRFEPRVRRMVRVVPDADVRPSEGFVISDQQVEPESVLVRGPSSVVTAIAYLSTIPLRLPEVRRTVTRQLPVDLPGVGAPLEITPAQVILTIEVDSLLARPFEVPVTARGSGSAGVVLEPRTVRVTVRGAMQAVRALTGAEISATVTIDGPLTSRRTYGVEIGLPPDLRATATPEPPRVTASPRAGGG